MWKFDATMTDKEVDDAIAEDAIEVFDALAEYDWLNEVKMNADLSPNQQRGLDELHETLRIKEQMYWEGVDSNVTDMMETYSDADFLMLRFISGLLTDSLALEQD